MIPMETDHRVKTGEAEQGRTGERVLVDAEVGDSAAGGNSPEGSPSRHDRPPRSVIVHTRD